METLCGDLLSSGIDLIVNAQVTDVDPKAKSLSTNNATYEYGHLINCAGAHATGSLICSAWAVSTQ